MSQAPRGMLTNSTRRKTLHGPRADSDARAAIPAAMRRITRNPAVTLPANETFGTVCETSGVSPGGITLWPAGGPASEFIGAALGSALELDSESFHLAIERLAGDSQKTGSMGHDALCPGECSKDLFVLCDLIGRHRLG